MKKTLSFIVLSGLLAIVQTTGVDPETLKQADRVFAEQTAQRGLDGWVEAFAPDGKLVGRGGVTEGHDAIRTAMGALDRSDFSLSWEPLFAEGSGDLGYTHGTYRRERVNSEGKAVVETGRYVTIWRRNADGKWKVVLDIGT